MMKYQEQKAYTNNFFSAKFRVKLVHVPDFESSILYDFCRGSGFSAERGRPGSSSVLGRRKISGENSSQKNVGQRGCRRLIRKGSPLSNGADASPSARPPRRIFYSRVHRRLLGALLLFRSRRASNVCAQAEIRNSSGGAARNLRLSRMPKHSRSALFANRLLHSRTYGKLRA